MPKVNDKKVGMWVRGKASDKATIGPDVARKILEALPTDDAKEAFRTILTPKERAALEE